MSETKKHVCVIGAGPSGLIVMKELQDGQHTFKAFDANTYVGGAFVKSYDSTLMTTSSLLSAWSDHSDSKEANPTFWTAEEYIMYLHCFGIKHDLLKHIAFNTIVHSIKKCNKTGKWLVTVIDSDTNYLEYEEDSANKSKERKRIHKFDAIAVCSGTNTIPHLPPFSGQESFKGTITHSKSYFNATEFANKRVLIVGGGESASDILCEVSKIAGKCAIATRGFARIVSRTHSNGHIADLSTSRLLLSNPHVLGSWISYCNETVKLFTTSLLPASDSGKNTVARKTYELNLLQNSLAFARPGCKTDGAVEAMVLRHVEVFSADFTLTAEGAVFADGSTFACDTVIACTGYRNSFPFFEKHHSELAKCGQTPCGNYKHIFAIDYPGEIGFFGFAVPASGAIPPVAEMQARMWALVLGSKVLLPDKHAMYLTARQDGKQWERRFGRDCARTKGVVDFLMYCDGLAEIMGCMPPMRKLLLTKPSTWLKIVCGPLTVHQYRFAGPCADPTRAAAVLARQPYGDLLEACIAVVFLVLANVLYTLGFKAFKPSMF
jgi:dimethylaniline monooxygenase (N-oxide forming)